MAIEHREHAPQHLPHLPTLGEILDWMGHHKTRLTMAAIALGGVGYTSYLLARSYYPDTQVKTTVPVSDTFKPSEPAGITIIPTVSPTETPIPPAATASPSPEPTVVTPTSAPKDEPTAEVIKVSDCGGILSSEACALLRPSYRVNPDGSRQLLGFVGNLPVGEKVFADITGEFAKITDSNGKPVGILSKVEGSKRKTTDISGKIEFTGKKTADGRHINETITTPGITPIAIIIAPPDTPDGFNFDFALEETQVSTGKTVSDMERVKKYFPDLEIRVPYVVPVPPTASNREVIVTDKFQ